MRWPRRRRPTQVLGTHRLVPITSATPPADPAPADPAVPAEPVAVLDQPRVCLGFTDGSDIELPAAHPHAVALRAVADVLLVGPVRR